MLWQMMLDECHRYARLAGRYRHALPARFRGARSPKRMSQAEALGMALLHRGNLRDSSLARHAACRWSRRTTIGSTTPRLLELTGRGRSGRGGWLWDVEHPWRRGETPADTARALRPYLRHTHFKDSVGAARGRICPGSLGEGELPLLECVAALKAVGYDGWCSLEAGERWHPQECPEPEATLPQFVQFMRTAWGEA